MTLYSAQQHRAHGAYLRTLPGPKAKRAAELAELVAKAIELTALMRTTLDTTGISKRRAAVERRVGEKLAHARQNAELWSKIAAHPGMSPAAALAAMSARSHRAGVILYEKAPTEAPKEKAPARGQPG